jgi:hypothetical protein
VDEDSSIRLLTLGLVASRKITLALVPSRAESSEQGNSHVYAVCDRLCEIRIGAKLLAEADEDQRLDQLVEVAFHSVALLGRKNP